MTEFGRCFVNVKLFFKYLAESPTSVETLQKPRGLVSKFSTGLLL